MESRHLMSRSFDVEYNGADAMLPASATSEDDVYTSSDDDKQFACTGLRSCGCFCCSCVAVSVVVAFCLGLIIQPRPPSVEMDDMELSTLDIPRLGIRGLAPADTTQCDATDACGALTGCAKCPEGFVQHGCVCSPPEPGAVIQSNHSNCPSIDPCGVIPAPFGAKGCSTCPDSSWINGGCVCRRPLSIDQAVDQIHEFAELITGQVEFPVKMIFDVNATVCNPNFIGAQTEPGTIELFWQDKHIGTANVDGIDIGAKAAKKIFVVVAVDKVSRGTGTGMLQEMLSNEGELQIGVHGAVTAKVWNIPLQTQVSCNVTANVMQGNKIVRKHCVYRVLRESIQSDTIDPPVC